MRKKVFKYFILHENKMTFIFHISLKESFKAIKKTSFQNNKTFIENYLVHAFLPHNSTLNYVLFAELAFIMVHYFAISFYICTNMHIN